MHTLKGKRFLETGDSLALPSSQCSLLCISCLIYKRFPDPVSFLIQEILSWNGAASWCLFWQTKQIDLLLSFAHTASSSAFNLVSSSLCQNHVFKYSNHNYAIVGTINAAFFLLLLLLCSIYRLSSYIHLFRVALHSWCSPSAPFSTTCGGRYRCHPLLDSSSVTWQWALFTSIWFGSAQ